MKALILAGGRGKRLDDLSANNNKCMIKIRDRHVIEYSLDNAISADVTEIIIVVGYRAEDIINHFGNSYKGKKLKYVIQWEQRGLVHAIERAKDVIGNDDFILLLGDEIMLHPKHKEMVDEFNRSNPFALCGILHVEDKEMIKRTYTLIQDENNRIHRLIEKPRNPLNNLQGTGDCVFNRNILNYIDITPIHHERNERELPDLIQCAIDDGKIIRSFNICEKYTNINTRDDIRIAENFL
jgi:dTDP-glucose pyrophosphorylase